MDGVEEKHILECCLNAVKHLKLDEIKTKEMPSVMSAYTFPNT